MFEASDTRAGSLSFGYKGGFFFFRTRELVHHPYDTELPERSASRRSMKTVNHCDHLANHFRHRSTETDNHSPDVRKKREYLREHVENALNIELDYLNDKMALVPQEETFYIHCAGGYRSVIAASILKARGYHNMIDVAGGFSAIKETSISVSDYVCPTTL